MRRTRYPLLFIPTQQQKFDNHPQQSWLGIRCGLYIIHWDPRWRKSTSLSTDTSGIHLQTQKILQNTSWEPDHWKRIYRTRQHSAGQRKEGKKRGEWVELDLHLGLGTEAGTEVHGRANICDRGEALRLLESEAADQWESEWNEDHTDNPCHRCTYTRQGCKSPRKCFRLELEHRDWKAIPWQGLLLTEGRWCEGTWERTVQWEMLMKQSQLTWRQRDTAESDTEDGVISIASLSAHISTRQLKQHREDGLLKTWCAKQHRRTPARVIFKSLMRWTTDNDPNWGGCKCLKGSSNREGPAKEALWWPDARS